MKLPLPLVGIFFAFGLLSAARSQIVYTNPVDIQAAQDVHFPFNNIFVSMGTGGSSGAAQNTNFDTNIADFQINFASDPTKPQIILNSSFNHIAYDIATSGLRRFALNEVIDNASVGNISANPAANLNDVSAGAPGYNGANWAPGTTGYVGVTFLSGGRTLLQGGNPVYGWLQISYNVDLSITLYDFAYEASGAAILAGAAVPEPSAYAAIAGVGALGLVFYRRRRQPRV